MIKNSKALLLGAVCCFSINAANSETKPQTTADAFTLSSSQLSQGASLPTTFTCDGKSISPPLNWSNAPAGTKSFAILMDHQSPDGMHWYWTLYNISADETQIESGETLGKMGTNSVNGQNKYAPPCSKGPGLKSYTYTVYALSAPLIFEDNTKVDRDALLAAIKDITLASADMDVSYERSGQGSAKRGDAKRPPRDEGVRAKPPEMVKPDLTVNIDSPRCDAIRGSVNDAGFNKRVSVTCNEEYAYLASTTYPDHELMTGITGTNEQIPVPALDYAAPVKLNPKKAAELTSIDAAVGVAVNGVPIYDYSAQGELDLTAYDATKDTFILGQLDVCGGHSGRGDDYHYHVSPTCMIDTMKNKGDDAIIGWGYDGYPLYGHKNPDGTEITAGTLDVCNGQTDDTFGYRYQTSVTPPYIIQCLVGEVDTSVLPRVSPLSGDTQKIRADLRPPKGGVENLKHVISDDGTRTMTYSYQGEEYFTTYSPSKQGENCYDFKQRTISNGGDIESGTFCRGTQPSEAAASTEAKPPKPAATPLAQTTATGQFAPVAGKPNLKLEAWADNWFAAYIGEDLLIEDSVSITTERSFNAESIAFSTSYPIQLNFILKDFKQNDSGLEYIGASNQQMGDGGFIMQVTDTETNNVVAVSDKSWKCEVLHKAPLDKACESESDPVAGEGACTFMAKDAPANWLQSSFDDSAWANATEHTVASVSPKDGYDEIKWDDSAQLVWGEDLEQDNTLICRTTIEKPAE
ncbi:YHYH protein [Leucothrix arctica]|uniref:PEBP family protein n=1 Tax=Leucothrix arctica TaxID=1481894 RepID=A0A317CES5_9GAMM|nr:YHYH protein [Leucothrix arctica]PWQ97154.1 PEBP family protein [Leucothrix arctica]